MSWWSRKARAKGSKLDMTIVPLHRDNEQMIGKYGDRRLIHMRLSTHYVTRLRKHEEMASKHAQKGPTP